jgi:hypothetical protein
VALLQAAVFDSENDAALAAVGGSPFQSHPEGNSCRRNHLMYFTAFALAKVLRSRKTAMQAGNHR